MAAVRRRSVVQGLAATGIIAATDLVHMATAQRTQADMVLRNGRFTTLDRSNPVGVPAASLTISPPGGFGVSLV